MAEGTKTDSPAAETSAAPVNEYDEVRCAIGVVRTPKAKPAAPVTAEETAPAVKAE